MGTQDSAFLQQVMLFNVLLKFIDQIHPHVIYCHNILLLNSYWCFIMQASYITGGVYLKPQELNGLFQYLAVSYPGSLRWYWYIFSYSPIFFPFGSLLRMYLHTYRYDPFDRIILLWLYCALLSHIIVKGISLGASSTLCWISYPLKGWSHNYHFCYHTSWKLL